jgi:hypothetical protein
MESLDSKVKSGQSTANESLKYGFVELLFDTVSRPGLILRSQIF